MTGGKIMSTATLRRYVRLLGTEFNLDALRFGCTLLAPPGEAVPAGGLLTVHRDRYFWWLALSPLFPRRPDFSEEEVFSFRPAFTGDHQRKKSSNGYQLFGLGCSWRWYRSVKPCPTSTAFGRPLWNCIFLGRAVTSFRFLHLPPAFNGGVC